MKRFIDRIEEMKTLETEYKREGSSLVILYGRRRVGKTTLIAEFIKNKNAMFYLASEESEIQNRNAFKEKAAEFTNNDLLKNAQVSSWDMIFRVLMDTSYEKKPVIVIDEFQYLGKANPAFPSVFQRIWEEILKDKSVMVILCGSLISMMVSQTLAYSSPLYGRRTAQICLKQIPFLYYKDFFQNQSVKERIEMYAISGGVPKYIESFAMENDIYEAIEKHVLNKSSYLYDEPKFLLQQEVSEVGSYFSIIRAIAAGNSKLSAISKVLEIKATTISKYLNTLMELDILEREVPVTEDNPEKSKKGLYKIKDNYLRFWFMFVYPNRSFLESGHSELVMKKIKNSFLKNQVAYVFEDVCKEWMWELNFKDAWRFHFSKLGRYWDSSTEIDVVALDPEDNNMIVGECKYWNRPIGISVLESLEEKSASVSWNRNNRRVWYVLFSTGGFSDKLQELAKQREDVLLIG